MSALYVGGFTSDEEVIGLLARNTPRGTIAIVGGRTNATLAEEDDNHPQYKITIEGIALIKKL